MIGIALLLLIGGYVWVAKKIVYAAWEQSGRLAVALLAIFVVAPLGDAVGGRAVLKSRCKREGQIVFIQRIPDVQGLRIEGMLFDDSPRYYGYDFVESSGDRVGDWLATAVVDRAVRETRRKRATIEHDVLPIAKYALVDGRRETSGYYFTKSHVAVIEIATRREIAYFDWFEFRGGWAERLVDSFSDAGPGIVATCGDARGHSRPMLTMLHSALMPLEAGLQSP